MAEITIRFRHDPATGKHEIVVLYESDEDALPHEHERDHRALVEEILGRPIGDDETIVVEREDAASSGTEESAERDEALRRQARREPGG